MLKTGDLLVINNTKVIPAKFICHRRTGAKIDGLFLRQIDTSRWEVMLRGAGRCRLEESLGLKGAEEVLLYLREDLGQGRWIVEIQPPTPATEILPRVGLTPLPPYIQRSDGSDDKADRQGYQTVYARHPGAVAAPTAGLHFTQALLDQLVQRGMQLADVTLHVGPGTFAPVKCQQLRQHPMHAEWYNLPAHTAERINAAQQENRRIVAVGTTSVRVIETAARHATGKALTAESGWTDLFLYPPAEFHAIDALITNFHLPQSTLLMLVAAFCSPGQTNGLATILQAYAEAQRREYRFYSYGDAMLIE